MTRQTCVLKWTNGTVLNKTLREDINKINDQNEQLVDNIPKYVITDGTFFKKTSDRDVNNEKLMSRYMVTQTNTNPFMADNDYLKDLEVQNKFLKPQNSGIMN